MIFLMYYGGLSRHRSILLLLAYALAGSVAGFLVMFFAPGKAYRLGTPPTVDVFILRTLRFPLEFLMDTLRSAPIPTLFLFCVSGVVVFCAVQVYKLPVPRFGVIVLRMAIVLIVMYILIATSFAPSVYGQSYPIARARFVGYLFFNIAVLLTGGFIGMWLANIVRFSWALPLV